jgi:DNA invertase Pin-like site-specific DNA recombinase
MVRGYARPTNLEFGMDVQLAALTAAGCEVVYEEDEALRTTMKYRPAWRCLMKEAVRGDVVVVYRLSRIGRSPRFLWSVIKEWEKRGVEFRSLCEGVDSRNGFYAALRAVHGMEIDYRRSQYRYWLAELAARGVGLPRRPPPPTVMGAQGAAEYAALVDLGYTQREIADMMKVHISTFTGKAARRVRADIEAGRI